MAINERKIKVLQIFYSDYLPYHKHKTGVIGCCMHGTPRANDNAHVIHTKNENIDISHLHAISWFFKQSLEYDYDY